MLRELSSLLKQIDQAARGPSLSRTLNTKVSILITSEISKATHRILTKRPILIRQLGQSGPRTCPNHLHTPFQPSRHLLKALNPLFSRLASHEIEPKQRSEEEACGPEPLGALMIIAAFCRGGVG